LPVAGHNRTQFADLCPRTLPEQNSATNPPDVLYLPHSLRKWAKNMGGTADWGRVHNPLQHIAVGTRVRVYPGTDREAHGAVVEDFGEAAGYPVEIGRTHIVDAARRWAVQLDTGGLVFVDSNNITAA